MTTTGSSSRTALVTGAATGIGLAITRRLRLDDWRVLGTAMPGQDASALTATGAELIEVDLVNSASRDALVRLVAAEPRLDALVSNAGIAVPAPLEGIPADLLRQQIELNAIVPLILAQAVLPQLRATRGRMIFIGAGQGRVALPFGGPYGASKAALAALTDSLRTELDGAVSVSLIEPGAVRTGILDDSRQRGLALLERLPAELVTRYREPLLATLRRSTEAFAHALAPEEIADLVARILSTNNPKPRYLVGREANVLAALAVLPARWRGQLTSRLLR